MFNWNIYNGNLTWLEKNTIYLTEHGSIAYGTNLPTSDLDLRGICVAPKEYYLGFNMRFEQVDQHEPDLTIFDIRKFFALAADCNPNALEIIFTDPEHHLIETPVVRKLLENREAFLSQKVKYTLSGYAHSQLKRIKLHRNYLLHPCETPPTRAEFGLPERTTIPADQLEAAKAAIKKQLDAWSWHELEDVSPSSRLAIQEEFERRLLEITQWSWEDLEENTYIAATKNLGYDTNFIELLDRERRYTAKHREYKQYQDWKKNRNPARAAMEEKFGFDGKHALHLSRLTRMCKELLSEGKLIVKRPDAEELLAIRHGAWTFDQLMDWFEQQQVEIEALVKTTKLPHHADRAKLNSLCMEIIEEHYSSL
jgi:uncharacterized protein